MKNSNVYALLISVGDYEAIGLKNLPTYKGDPVLLGTSLTLGLNVPQDQIRIISGDERPGFVRTATFARAIGEMKSPVRPSISWMDGAGDNKKMFMKRIAIICY